MAISPLPALDTPELLVLDPKLALCVIAGYHNSVTLDAGRFTLSVPQVVSGRTTKIVFTPIPGVTGLGQEYLNTYTLTYRRLDMATYFADLDTALDIATPTYTQNIAQALGEKLGIVFTAADIEQSFVALGETSVTLTAKAGSLRWVGSVQIPIHHDIPLSQIVANPYLPGFDDFNTAFALDNNWPDSVLLGFDPADISTNTGATFVWGEEGVPTVALDPTYPTVMLLDTVLGKVVPASPGIVAQRRPARQEILREMDVTVTDIAPQTELRIDVKPNSKSWFGGVIHNVRYTRAHLPDFFRQRKAVIVAEEEVTQDNIAGYLNALSGLSLTKDDFVFAVTSVVGSTTYGTVTPVANLSLTAPAIGTSEHVLWKGVLSVEISGGGVHLDNVVLVGDGLPLLVGVNEPLRFA